MFSRSSVGETSVVEFTVMFGVAEPKRSKLTSEPAVNVVPAPKMVTSRVSPRVTEVGDSPAISPPDTGAVTCSAPTPLATSVLPPSGVDTVTSKKPGARSAGIVTRTRIWLADSTWRESTLIDGLEKLTVEADVKLVDAPITSTTSVAPAGTVDGASVATVEVTLPRTMLVPALM